MADHNSENILTYNYMKEDEVQKHMLNVSLFELQFNDKPCTVQNN